MRKSVLALFVFFLCFSCSKPDSFVEQEHPVVIEAKNWLAVKQQETKARVITSEIEAKNTFKKLPTVFESFWEKAIVHEEQDQSIIELSVKFDKAFLVENSKVIQNPKHYNGVTKLLVLKNKQTGAMSAVFMFMKADEINNPGDYQKLLKNTYKKKEKDFNGAVSFYNLDWTFINGWQFTNGDVSGKITQVKYTDLQASASQQNNEAKLTLTMPGTCVTKTTSWYLTTCYYYTDGSAAGCTSQYLYSTTEQVCSTEPGSGGGGGVSPTPSSDPLATPPNMAQWEQDYRARMSVEETKIFDQLPRTYQLNYLNNAFEAQTRANILFPTSTNNNGKGDAFRHAYFHALNTNSLGADLSRRLGDAHEMKVGLDPLAVKMDLRNNAIGRTIYLDVPKQSSNGLMIFELKKETERRANNGNLWIIVNINGVPTLVSSNYTTRPTSVE